MRLQLDSSVAGTTRPGESVPSAPASGSGSDSRRVGSDGSGTQDSISISGVSGVLNRVFTDRAARIEALTSQVQGGTYQVSSGSVGSAIVEQALS
jgi:anti-sigma28 factor (negative regulator of flagellin synthesis)